MYGKNPIMKQDLDPDGRLWVQEVFATIQGEGVHAGKAAVFVRLCGCNLQCSFCDTEFMSGYSDPRNLWDPIQLRNLVMEKSAHINRVVITGGEPMRQNIAPFIDYLLSSGYDVEIETAGTLWIPGFETLAFSCHITVSPKTGKVNKLINTFANAWKYIIIAGEVSPVDGLPTKTPTGKDKEIARPGNNAPVYVQACDDREVKQSRANIEDAIQSAKVFGHILSVQIHKYIGVE